MKYLPLASLTLIASVSLTGCASTSTIEDQTKLVEYERCVSWNEMLTSKMIDAKIAAKSSDIEKIEFEEVLQSCEEYRP